MTRTSEAIDEGSQEQRNFERSLTELRPKLHRYCSRMVGSAVDGEDVVQEVLIKAVKAYSGLDPESLENWLFHVAHNCAVDFLRSRRRREAHRSGEDVPMAVDLTSPMASRLVAAASLRAFMYLPVAERGCVILMDVIGYSLQEIAGITNLTIPAVKASLHRGRARIRDVAEELEDGTLSPALSQDDLRRLASYVDRFNARDFDAVRDMLADDVRLELVSRKRMEGREQVSRYFHNYSGIHDWRFACGLVDQRPALLVLDPRMPAARPGYFVLLEYDGAKVAAIRDFRHARYVAESAEMIVFGAAAGTS